MLAIVACGCSSESGSDGLSPVPTPSLTTTDGPDWSYEGDTGPAHWADLSSKYATCGGTRQSPIALTDAKSASSPSFRSLFVHDRGTVIDTGHSIQVNTTGGMINFDGTVYDLRQFHTHVPSEHTMNGTRYDAELHLVYKSDDQLTILGVFVKEGTHPHPTLDVWTSDPDTTVTLNPGRLRPASRGYYTYEGSITTPPCSETVRWIVMDKPIQASPDQLAALRKQYDHNARPLQPRENRALRHVTP